MEKARCNTELYSNLRGPLNNVKPSNFWGSHHNKGGGVVYITDYLSSQQEFFAIDDVDALGKVFHLIAVGGVEYKNTLCVVHNKF